MTIWLILAAIVVLIAISAFFSGVSFISSIAWGVGYAIFRTHDLLFDYLTFCLFIYLFVAWTQIPNEDILRIRHFVSTGELIEPLVHANDTWEPASWAPKWEH